MSKRERKVRGIRFGRDVASGFFFGPPVDVVPRKKGERELRKGKKRKTWAHLWRSFFGHRSQGKLFFPTFRFSKLNIKGNHSRKNDFICRFVKIVKFCEGFAKEQCHTTTFYEIISAKLAHSHKKTKKGNHGVRFKISTFFRISAVSDEKDLNLRIEEKKKKNPWIVLRIRAKRQFTWSIIYFLSSFPNDSFISNRKEGESNISRRENASVGVIWTNASRSKAHTSRLFPFSFSLYSHLPPPPRMEEHKKWAATKKRKEGNVSPDLAQK